MRIAVSGTMRLAAEKRAGVARINAMADAVRRRFITPIIGQEMIYIEKETEARRFIAMETLPNDLTDFPFIASEVGVTAPSAYEVAQLYLNLGAQWRVVGSQLENLRLSSITAIESATTLSQITQTIAYAEQVIQSFQ